jgi:competence protein ComEA
MSIITEVDMKLGTAQKVLLAVTALFVTFTLAFFIGRSSVHAQITTERAPETLVRELPAAQSEPEEPQKLELNRATRAELEALPGIGPVLAERIDAWREANGPFVSVEQIMDVEGIGEKKLDELRDSIYVEDVQ